MSRTSRWSPRPQTPARWRCRLAPGTGCAGRCRRAPAAPTGDLRRFVTEKHLLPAGTGAADDDRLADALRLLFERHGDLHVIVTEYVSALADTGRAPSTIERALAAIAAAHRAAGAGALRTDGPRQVLRSYRRDRATTGTGVRVRKVAPVTIAALLAVIAGCAGRPAAPDSGPANQTPDGYVGRFRAAGTVLQDAHSLGPPPSMPDFTSPCPVPAGGWRPVDAAKATDDARQAVTTMVDADPDFAGLWVDQKVPSYVGSTPANDPAELVLNVRFTKDLARHEAAIRKIWGGSLCVSEPP